MPAYLSPERSSSNEYSDLQIPLQDFEPPPSPPQTPGTHAAPQTQRIYHPLLSGMDLYVDPGVSLMSIAQAVPVTKMGNFFQKTRHPQTDLCRRKMTGHLFKIVLISRPLTSFSGAIRCPEVTSISCSISGGRPSSHTKLLLHLRITRTSTTLSMLYTLATSRGRALPPHILARNLRTPRHG